jgi:hypothetical protein
VSPLSSDEVSLWLAPDRLEIVRKTGLFRKRRVYSHAFMLREEQGVGSTDRMAAALDHALAKSQAQQATLRITLSNTLVRFSVLQWQPGIVRIADQEALARATYRSIYGDRADEWVIALSDRRPGRSFVAAAIDRELVEALERVAAGGGHRITSVSPLFSRAFDGFAGGRGPDGWFATVEPGQVCAGYAGDSAWQLVRSRSIRRFVPEELLILLDQARYAGGIERPAGMVRVFWRSVTPFEMPEENGWSLVAVGAGGSGDARPAAPPSLRREAARSSGR